VETSRLSSGLHRPRVVLSVGFVVLAAGVAAYWYWAQAAEPARAARPPARLPVPVSIAVVARQDRPVHVTGLGTVQASSTVRIHSQIDGKLQDVLFTEGQHVKKGEVLAKIDPRLFQAALDQAKARKAQDAAMLVAAEKDLARSKALAIRDFASQQNVDQQQAKVDQLKASIAAGEAAIETAQTQLDYTTIIAPSDGRIGIRLVDAGNLVRASDTGSIATLMLTRPIAVIFTLPGRYLGDVRRAMARGPVEVIAYDQDNRRVLSTGTLLLVDNAVDQASGTIRLKAMFANDEEELWPGESVNARLLLETRSSVLAVPPRAIQRGPQGLLAWVITPTNTAEPRSIEVGPTTGDQVIITSGLNEGERVVIDGHYKLARNAPVSITTPSSRSSGTVK
jgi:membrane fusion protein, multidrug efflux system